MTSCIVDGCSSLRWSQRATGYCVKHQRRVDRHGDPNVVRGFRSHEERFRASVHVADDGCWLWRGTLNDKGYGKFYVDGRQRPAHRWSYEHFVGPIPDGLEPDHLCRVRNCVNPNHLDPVTHRENSQRAAYSRTTCVRGHELPEPGPDGGRRVCRTCANERNRAYKARKRFERLTGVDA